MAPRSNPKASAIEPGIPDWRGFWDRFAPRCTQPDCTHNRRIWRRVRRKEQLILLQGSRYCRDGCLERVLQKLILSSRVAAKAQTAAHRIPLGLLLLSRGQLTVEQLHAALEAQRQAGRGKIGEWLQALGFVQEQQVTAALARQWSCPVLRRDILDEKSLRPNLRIPVTLLRSLFMLPVDFVAGTATLHIAFGDGVNYRVLYAIEQMLGCKTESCLATPSLLHKHLAAMPERRDQFEIVFEDGRDTNELVRIIRSYSVRLGASELRLVRCGPHLWVRLLRPAHPPVDLVLGSRSELQPDRLSLAPAAMAV